MRVAFITDLDSRVFAHKETRIEEVDSQKEKKPGMERFPLLEKATTGVHPGASLQVMMTQTQSNMGRDVYGGPRNGQMNT